MGKRTVECHVCPVIFKLKENDPDFQTCPCCGTDMQNPQVETRTQITPCDYCKSTTNSDVGHLVLTNKRILWIKDRLSITSNNIAAYMTANVLSNRGADKIGFEVPLEEIDQVQQTKKGLIGKTITIYTKGGEQYQLQPSKQNLEIWKQALATYIR